MRKKINKIILFLFCVSLNAQTIKVNENKYVSIIFDSNIIQGAVGNEDFVFEYNPDGSENIALLKATKKNAKETNLIVKTADNTLFNVNIEYGFEVKNIIQFTQSDGVNINNTKKNSKNKNIPVADNEENLKASIRENDYTIGNKVIMMQKKI
ncbi:MAG: hypothetical protein HC854_04055 [Flavobacterium sp.]|nr:hypothetical protein [Flavobacterium sp.]